MFANQFLTWKVCVPGKGCLKYIMMLYLLLNSVVYNKKNKWTFKTIMCLKQQHQATSIFPTDHTLYLSSVSFFPFTFHCL